MPENSSSRDVAVRKKRKISTRGPSSSAGALKRQKAGEPRVSIPASASQVKVDPGLRLCTFCTENILGKDNILDDMDDSSCLSCELVANAVPANVLSEAIEEAKRGARYNRFRPNKFSIYQEVEIMSRENYREYGTLLVGSNHNESPVVIPETIDFKTPTAWLERCKKVHGKDCDQRDFPLRYSEPINVILVDVIRDCITVKTTASRYFALSYVWGGAVTTTTTTRNFLAFQQPGSLKRNLVLPKTVSDAMLLTRKMGMRYLWVDCLSIIQDSLEKHQDIADMDVIFSQAELTVVATGIEHANSGLPGVRQGTRRRRITSKMQGGHILTLKLPLSKYTLLFGTTYNSRGWTFQELLVSKRVLFVTEHQVVFHCGTSRCSESLPEEEPHHNGELGFGPIELRSKDSLARSSYVILQSYTAMVGDYSRRRLSFQSDIENAFSGLASILEQWCEGYPVIHGMMSSFFGYSMFWTFRNDQDYFSSYSKAEIGKRREGFPSWSWMGWVTCVRNIVRGSAIDLPLQSLVRKVEITYYSERTASRSFSVSDKTAKEDPAQTEQQIQINFEPTKIGSKSSPLGTLGFDAERTGWKNFAIECSTAPGPIFCFCISGKSSPCGFLSIAPDEETSNKVFNQELQAGIDTDCDWSLVRLYHLRLKPWRSHFRDDIQVLLDDIEFSETVDVGSADNFRNRLQRSNLVYVLLIRRHGLYWERVGSGLMFARHWPSTSTRAKARAYHERIVLI